MSLDDRKRIQANYSEIVRDLRNYDIVDVLYQNAILGEEDVEYVDFMERRLTPQEGNRRLIAILFNRGSRAFSCFCKALEDQYPELAAKIRNTDPSTVDSSIAEQSDPAFRQNHLQDTILEISIALLVHDLLLLVLFIGMILISQYLPEKSSGCSAVVSLGSQVRWVGLIVASHLDGGCASGLDCCGPFY